MSFVVIVEPDEFTWERLNDFLETADKKFEYSLVRTPDRAVEIMEQCQVDVLVSEVEMPIISGQELFAMAEMISPNTVRIAMTSAKRIEDTVAFMNACKTYKIIITPCKMAGDIIDPIEAAIRYKKLMNQARSEEEAIQDTINEAEADYQNMEQTVYKNKEDYQNMLSVIRDLVYKNLEKRAMSEECSAKMKHWYVWLLNAYYQTMIASNGNYILAKNNLLNDFHSIEKNRRFVINKKTDFEINPAKMNEISYILTMLANTCRLLLPQYYIQVLLEDSEKYYIVRFECRYTDSLDAEKKLVLQESNDEYVEELKKATEKMTDIFSYRSVLLQKEESVLLNIAVER